MNWKLSGTRRSGALAALTLALAAATGGCAQAEPEGEDTAASSGRRDVIAAEEPAPDMQGAPAQPTSTASERPTTVEEAMASNHGYWTADSDVEAQQERTDISLSESAQDGTVTITKAGTYVLTGDLKGQLVVAAGEEDQVTLVFSGVSIANPDGPAVLLESADGVRIELAEGTESSLSDGETYAEDAEANAALFSRVDLNIDGTGKLAVSGNGEDGIASKDDLVIVGGVISVTATDDGLRGKDALVVTGGTVDVTAAGDGLKTTNDTDSDRGYVLQTGGDITVRAGDDGVDSVADALFTGGTLTILESDEGVEAVNLIVEGGDLEITSSDDGMNATAGSSAQSGEAGPGGGGFADDGSNLVLSGGTVTINAEGDGIDSNGNLTISGGSVTVFGTTKGGNGAFDANGTFTLSGGNVLALSAGQMEQGPSAVEQAFAEVSLTGQAGQAVEVAVAGENALSVEAPKQFGYLFYSSPQLEQDQQLTVTVGTQVVEATATLEPSGGTGEFGGPGGPPERGQGGPGMGTPPGERPSKDPGADDSRGDSV